MKKTEKQKPSEVAKITVEVVGGSATVFAGPRQFKTGSRGFYGQGQEQSTVQGLIRGSALGMARDKDSGLRGQGRFQYSICITQRDSGDGYEWEVLRGLTGRTLAFSMPISHGIAGTYDGAWRRATGARETVMKQYRARDLYAG